LKGVRDQGQDNCLHNRSVVHNLKRLYVDPLVSADDMRPMLRAPATSLTECWRILALSLLRVRPKLVEPLSENRLMSPDGSRVLPHEFIARKAKMGFLDRLTKALLEIANEKKASGKFKFQEENASPGTDSKGRVIVKVQTGSSIILGVNKQDCSVQAERFLLGKPEAYKEVEGKSVRLRIQRDLQSPYPDSVSVETPKGDFVGWILKEDSAVAAKVLDSLALQIKSIAPEIESIIFDVGAQVDGTYDEDEDENGQEVLIPDLENLEIRIKDPAEIDIHPEGK
jgi:hypothetical protein